MIRNGIVDGANVALHTEGVAMSPYTTLLRSWMPGIALCFRLDSSRCNVHTLMYVKSNSLRAKTNNLMCT